MLQEWDLKPRASACACCNTAFTDRQTYHSALVFGDDGYLRKEYCMPCWAGQPLQNEPYSMWQGVYRTPPPAPEERNFSGRPSIVAIQSSTCVSSSVQAGLVAQSMPCTPSPAESSSPRMEGPELLAGK